MCWCDNGQADCPLEIFQYWMGWGTFFFPPRIPQPETSLARAHQLAMTSTASSTDDLKHLGFVKSYGEKAVTALHESKGRASERCPLLPAHAPRSYNKLVDAYSASKEMSVLRARYRRSRACRSTP